MQYKVCGFFSQFNLSALFPEMEDKLAALEKKINVLIKKQEETTTVEDQIEMYGISELLADVRASVLRYESFIALAVKGEASKSFSDADGDWIQAVTGVNTTYRKWTGYRIDDNIQPRPGFQTKFEEVAKAFHQHNEAGRRIFLNLFLSDIILREEFLGALRIFPELKVSVVETKGSKKRKLNGIIDYTVGFGKGKDIFDNTIPREVHLVAVEAKTSIGEQDLWQCVAEAASLYKTRVDAGKENNRVWGILSNAQLWQFVFIDEDGFLWRSEYFLLDLRSYDESKVLQVYRMVHYIVKCCHEACSPSPSMASSVDSLE
jgi:hypothetical protein